MFSQFSETASLAKDESNKNNITATCSLLAVANKFSSGLGKAPKIYSTPYYMSKTFDQYVPLTNNREAFLRVSSKSIVSTYEFYKKNKADASK